MTELVKGSVAWADLSPAHGREQSGRRPVVVVASAGYLAAVTTLAIVVPVTTVDRGWPHHLLLRGPTGLGRPSWAIAEQPRTLSRERLGAMVGLVDRATLDELDGWLRDFLGI